MALIEEVVDYYAVVCPYCKHEHTDFCDYGNLEMGREFECNECGEMFSVVDNVSHCYTSTPIRD